MDLPGELWWRVLFSAGWPLGVGDAARTALARIDFQLGTNGGKVTGDARQWQAFFLSPGEPSIMSALVGAVKPRFQVRTAAMVQGAASLWGACAHLERPLSRRCNASASLAH